MAQLKYRDGQLIQLSLYPVDIGHGRPRSQRGRPVLANVQLGRKILKHMQNMSAPFGTQMEIEDDVGIIRLA